MNSHVGPKIPLAWHTFFKDNYCVPKFVSSAAHGGSGGAWKADWRWGDYSGWCYRHSCGSRWVEQVRSRAPAKGLGYTIPQHYTGRSAQAWSISECVSMYTSLLTKRLNVSPVFRPFPQGRDSTWHPTPPTAPFSPLLLFRQRAAQQSYGNLGPSASWPQPMGTWAPAPSMVRSQPGIPFS